MDPQAVIFDLDGVLIESEQVWDEVRRGLATDAGRPWPPETTTALQGMSTQEWSRHLVEVVGVPGPPERVAAEVINRLADRYRDGVPLLPGAVETVRALVGRWPLGVASSSPVRLIRLVLATAGVADLFGAAVSSEEVPRGKPAPDVYLEAAARLGVEPVRCVAVEDSSNGLRAAVAAGMVLVAAPNEEYPPAPDALALATVVVPGVAGVTPELITSLPG
ncbi:MAG TPA: HAD family phosphatase [Mycobacteriales bacterium]|nr:HAD family phosphatase [Mycobacteriales bacterium]